MYNTLLKYPSMHDCVALWSALKIITNILSKPTPFQSYQLCISTVFLHVVPICKILVTIHILQHFTYSKDIHFTYMYKDSIHEWRFHYL